MATAQRRRPACATTNLRVPISFRFYRETVKSLQEFFVGLLWLYFQYPIYLSKQIYWREKFQAILKRQLSDIQLFCEICPQKNQTIHLRSVTESLASLKSFPSNIALFLLNASAHEFSNMQLNQHPFNLMSSVFIVHT